MGPFFKPGPVAPEQKRSTGPDVLAVRSSMALGLDPSRTVVDSAALAKRGGAFGAAWAELAPGARPLFRWADRIADDLYGAAADQPATYAALRGPWVKRGQLDPLRTALHALPRTAIDRARDGAATPREAMRAVAGAWASALASPETVPFTSLARALKKEVRTESLRRLERELSPAERAAMGAGQLSIAKAARIAEARALTRVDVVVIGGGLAGLAAADQLARAGLSTVILEAGADTGGRLEAMRTQSGLELDLGGAWLHGASTNPLSPMVEALGLKTVRDDGPTLAAGPDGAARGKAHDERVAALDATWRNAGRSDRSAALVTPVARPEDRRAADALGPLSFGVSPSDVSSRDFATAVGEDEDRLTHPALATAAEAIALGLPVRTHAAVQRVRWGEGGVEVEAGGQTYRAGRAIVTVSTGVLASGAIHFDPPLPPSKQAAIAGLPMGRFEKVVVELAPGTLDRLPENQHIRDLDDERAYEVVARPHGHDVLVFLVGGPFAERLFAGGPEAAMEFARGRVRHLLGEAAFRSIENVTATDWGRAPHTLGAYSAARPEQHHSRAALAEPAEDRVFFAGEATASKWAQTAAGAFETGRRAAEEAEASLDRERRGRTA